jgi:predicted NBD/HSP70 family sugar kinase
MQSIVRLVDGLITRGLLRGAEKVSQGPGQPSLSIRLVANSTFALGVSMATDEINLVLLDLGGTPRADRRLVIDLTNRDRVVHILAVTIDDMLVKCGIDRSLVFGMGFAMSGFFSEGDRINPPAMLNDWVRPDLEDYLSNAFDLPVWLENDGSAGAAGESLFGAGRRYRNFGYLYISTGLGGGVVLDRKLFRGRTGNAGEFTGLLPPEDRPCRPTLQLLLDLVRERGVDVHSIAQLVREFDMAWPGVETWLERTRACTNAVISSIGAILDPDAIVIGGRIPRALAVELAAQCDFYRVPLRDRERPFPPVLVSEAPTDAAALGAAAIPLKDYFFG